MPTCPHCNGTKRTFRFVEYADGHGDSGYAACPTCAGTGEVTEAYLARRALGKRLRDWRVKVEPYESLRDVAKRFGLDVVALSHMEQGKEDIPEALWLAAGLGEREK